MDKLIIGFDAKRAAQNTTGLGNYSRFVVNLLEEEKDISRMLLFTPNPKKNECNKRAR